MTSLGMRPRVAFYAPPTTTHFRRCREVVRGMAEAGLEVIVLGGESGREAAESAGARFVDMFEGRPLERVDPGSFPSPVRWVTYTARFGAELIDQLRALDVQLVALDSHAMMGRLAAQTLDLPYVIARQGHINPAEAVPMLAGEPRLRVSDECWQAAEQLRDEYGLADASPFCWVPPASPYLNIVSEPEQFLVGEERDCIEPVGFFGSLTPEQLAFPAEPSGQRHFPPDATLRVYISLGMSGWNAARALMGDAPVRALRAIAAGLKAVPGAYGILALGGGSIDDELRAELEGPALRVEPHVDQMRLLAEADVFVTHHGIHSTHEAVAQRVPMLSYPLWWDQPGLARRCQELGLAIPLVEEPMAPLDPDTVRRALERMREERELLAAALAVARTWEEQVVADRPRVVERIAQFAGADALSRQRFRARPGGGPGSPRSARPSASAHRR